MTMQTRLSETLTIGSPVFPDVVPDPAVATAIAQTVARYRGRIASGDPLVQDPGVSFEIDASSVDVRVTPCGRRFICWAQAHAFALETCVEDYAAIALGRLIGEFAVVDRVLTCGPWDRPIDPHDYDSVAWSARKENL